jgi:hypothetical protein
MRRGLGLLFAIGLCLPVGVMAASPAGAVNTLLPNCKSLSGTQTFTPGLPPLSSNATVKPTTKTNILINNCSGGSGITKGTSVSTVKATKATNCKMISASNGKPGAPTVGTIKWSNGQTSTTSSVLTVLSANATTIKAKLVSKYTAGLGKGHTSTVYLTATPNKGYCVSAPFTKSTFHSTKITTT